MPRPEQRRREFLPQGDRQRARGGRSRLWWGAAFSVVALLWLAGAVLWMNPWTAAYEEAESAGQPLLRLECSGLGIGSGKGAISLVLDSAGFIRPPGETAAAALPFLAIEPVQRLIIGQPGPEPVFALAGGIASRWPSVWEERLGPLMGMRAGGGCCLRVETVEGVTLDFVAGDIERQFRNLDQIWRQSEKEGREIAAVNLMPERNVPVTFR